MRIEFIKPGNNVPKEVNVIIEVPAGDDEKTIAVPIPRLTRRYEVAKATIEIVGEVAGKALVAVDLSVNCLQYRYNKEMKR